ncbi:hypothetical protein [Fulvimarina sp. MAC8]|uniref:hypothetical protein n=1 Tax=Fulvimarina sp. MAC8 TaxID=3162874 RepID=UPI0032F01BDD
MTATARTLAFSPEKAPEEAVVIPFGSRGCPTVDARPSELSADDRDLLNRLRWLALKSRLQPKPEIERACMMLAGKGPRAIETVSNAFFRGLAKHGTNSLEFYRPGTRWPSSDEIWLLRLLSAFRQGREKEGSALVTWRIEPRGRRWLRFLAASLAELVTPAETSDA